MNSSNTFLKAILSIILKKINVALILTQYFCVRIVTIFLQKESKMKKFSSMVLMTVVLAGTSVFAAGIATLESVKGTPETLDPNDASWSKAKEIIVQMNETPYQPNGYKGMTKSTATVKSLHDDKNIYFKVQYDDPTMSTDRFPWQKQSDGSWKQLQNLDQAGQENSYYEDKFGVMWNINTKGFEKKGCAIACHMTKDGMNNGIADTSAGRKYTVNPGETLDTWHWKGVRTGLTYGKSHDQFVNGNTDPKINKGWGRIDDEMTAGSYKNNINEAKTGPAFMNKDIKDNATGAIKDENKVPFVDTFKVGDKIPGVVVTEYMGSGGDVLTSSVWKDGKWTLVFKRALITTHPKSAEQDIQFSDLTKKYYFAIAAFDNSQINHVYHDGSIELVFK